jgi:transcriptional regulator with XRE-family HTH domain
MKRNIKANTLVVEFGVAVRKRRHKLELSQEEFAEKANIHRTYVSSIELGKVDIGLGVAYKIAQALNTPLSTLIKETESKF